MADCSTPLRLEALAVALGVALLEASLASEEEEGPLEGDYLEIDLAGGCLETLVAEEEGGCLGKTHRLRLEEGCLTLVVG